MVLYNREFSSFHTREVITTVMVTYCGGVVYRAGHMRGRCRCDKQAYSRRGLMLLMPHWVMAYCYGCRRSQDAVSILAQVFGCRLIDAYDVLAEQFPHCLDK